MSGKSTLDPRTVTTLEQARYQIQEALRMGVFTDDVASVLRVMVNINLDPSPRQGVIRGLGGWNRADVPDEVRQEGRRVALVVCPACIERTPAIRIPEQLSPFGPSHVLVRLDRINYTDGNIVAPVVYIGRCPRCSSWIWG